MPEAERIRTAELISGLCLATDLGMGFPFEHGLQATLVTMRLCDVIGVDEETRSQTYYACLLMYSGCTTDADIATRLFPRGLTAKHTHRQFGSELESLAGVIAALQTPEDPLHRRAWQIVRRLPAAARFRPAHFAALCEVAQMLAERLGLPPEIHGLFPLLTERWDGKSVLRRAEGRDIPLPVRIVIVGRDATYQRLFGDIDHVIRIIRKRAGHAFDPDIADAFTGSAAAILSATESSGSVWDAVLAAEPEPHLTLAGAEIDRALEAIGAFADLASPHMTGHSKNVAELAATAAAKAGFDEEAISAVRRAGLLHDVGKASADPAIWQKPGRLTPDEWEQVRLGPYYTSRVFAHSAALRPLAETGSTHHERIDGSGYHRGLSGSALSPAARLLAAVDAYRSKIEPRPYREQYSAEQAAAHVVDKASEGKLDAEMVAATVAASGQAAPRLPHPADLTDREVQVIGLLARGLLTKQIAHELNVSSKTADHHIQNAYRKIGVSSRAGAALFAAEHGLVR